MPEGSPSPWGAVAGAVGGLINAGVGIAQRHKGKKLLSELGDQPIETIPNEVLQNQKMAQLSANTGLPSEQYNQAMKNIQRQQMIALKGAGDRRGGLLTTSTNQQAADDAVGKLDVADAQARIGNQKTLYTVNNQVGSWKDKLFKQNVLNPYMTKQNYAYSLLGIGNNNATTGLDQLAGAGALYGAAGGFGGRKSNTASSYHDYLMG